MTHWLVPLRQADEEVCWPLLSGPTVSDLAAIPFESVVAIDAPLVRMAEVVCQVTVWEGAGAPFTSASAWAVQSTVAPAATESMGVSAARVGGVPPMK